MAKVKKTSTTKPRIGRPPKTVSQIPSLVSASPSVGSTSNGHSQAIRAGAIKRMGRPPGSGAGKPGGNQLPQGVNALRAAIQELFRTKANRMTVPTAEQILKILVAL
jgi:hypothetical protein